MFESRPKHQEASMGYALFVLLGILVIVLGANLLYGAPINLMFILVWLFIYPACMYLGYSYKEINDAVYNSIKDGLGSVLIILAVGALIGAWIASGTVPAVIYYGLALVNPKFFLATAFLLCLLVSTACGTSWGAAGTAGIAMFAIGESMGVPTAMTVGAIVSGSFFGDMLSPLSDSSNVASAAAGVNLIEHCKEMCFIAIPAAVVTAIGYVIIGHNYSSGVFDASMIETIQQSLREIFHINWMALLPLVILFVLLFLKMSPVMALLLTAVLSGLTAIVLQGISPAEMFTVMWQGYTIESGDDFIDTLLNRGGMLSMAATAFMLMFSFGMVGALKEVGLLRTLISPLATKAKNVKSLTLFTELAAIFGNMLGTGAFSLIMVGSVMKPAYEEYHLRGTNLSKAIGSASTPTVALVPWNISAIYVFGLFGVSAIQYAPFALFSYIMPLMAFLSVLIGFRVFRDEEKPISDQTEASV